MAKIVIRSVLPGLGQITHQANKEVPTLTDVAEPAGSDELKARRQNQSALFAQLSPSCIQRRLVWLDCAFDKLIARIRMPERQDIASPVLLSDDKGAGFLDHAHIGRFHIPTLPIN